jgi:hypothetical protein
VTGNTAAWIILLAVASAAVIAVLAGLWVSLRREQRRDYQPAHKIRRRRRSPESDHPAAHGTVRGKMGRREGEGSMGFVNGQVYEDELIMGMTAPSRLRT